MPQIDEIRAALAALTPGTRISLTLDDGREITGNFHRLEDDAVYLEAPAESPVELRRIARVVIRLSSLGPE